MNEIFATGFEVGVLVGILAGAAIALAIVGVLLKRAVIG